MASPLPENIQQRPVAVIGGGTLGRRIAAVFIAGGSNVKLFARRPEQREEARRFVDKTTPILEQQLKAKDIHANRGQLETPGSIEAAVPGAWLVVESISEQLEAKCELFGQLDHIADRDALLATNSSSYPSRRMMGQVQHRERALNMHFFIPPELMPVELMSNGDTRDGLLEALAEILPRYGLLPFIAQRESTGFIVNRIWAAIKREALAVVGEGVSTPEDVDGITRAMLGFAPFRLMDRVGLDVVLDIEKHYADENPHLPDTPRKLLVQYLEAGKLGQKSGEGFYKYE
ncbi:MAG: 3-hydroxyacyl-CoA dehydrogenase family protein [Sinobacteraceae bacterium]|nr:3-hydroxyacyl-CoA dehydrogenase family protein [Nevskiaceae bacterium]